MSNSKLGYKHKLRVDVISPVAVGNGSVLSPLSDYSVFTENKNKYARLLDRSKFENALSESNSAIITDYVNLVNESIGAEGDKGEFLYKFIKNNLGTKAPELFFHTEQIPINGDVNAVELKTCIKENQKPFIPGTTLKGAFKSALLFNWLIEHPQAVDDIFKVIQTQSKYSNALKEINSILDSFLDTIFKKDERFQFSTFRVTDLFIEGGLEWYHCKRFKLKNDVGAQVPTFLEAIASGAYGVFEIDLEDNSSAKTYHYGISDLKGTDLTHFFEKVNRYALENIEHELAMTTNSQLSAFTDFLALLKDKITHSNNRYCLLPIGFGKSNFYQSIGLFIWKKNKKLFEKYIQLFKMGKKPDYNKGETDQKELPLTRNLTIQGHLPLGWVQVSQVKERRSPEKAAKIEKGAQVEATLVRIGLPYSKVKIPGIDTDVEMTGSKEAKKDPYFTEGATVLVEIELNKEGKISQTKFIKVL